MDATLYASHWEPSDAAEGIPAPEITIEPDEDGDNGISYFYLRIRAGHRYTRSQILVSLTRPQLETLIDAGKVALQERSNCL